MVKQHSASSKSSKSSALVEWSDDLVVGEPTLDHQHKEIFLLTTLLDKAIKDPEFIQKIISFLDDYTVDHFSDEERFMISHDYDGYDVHKAYHEYFKVKVAEIKKQATLLSENKVKLIFPIRQLIDEIIQHIIQVDSKLRHISDDGNTNSH